MENFSRCNRISCFHQVGRTGQKYQRTSWSQSYSHQECTI